MKPSISLIQLQLRGERIPCLIERKRIKNINLRVRPDESVYVSVPFSVSDGQIESFIVKEKSYIIQMLQKIRDYKAAHPLLSLSDGDRLYVDGVAYTLDYRVGLTNEMYRKGGTIYMTTKDRSMETKRKVYHRFLFRQGERLFPKSVDRVWPLLREYQLEKPTFRQRVMTSRWGSCMPQKGMVALNTFLAIMPGRIVDHVVLHELCHLIQPNHSQHFYNIMTMAMPDWQERRAAMEQYMAYCV